MCRVERRSFSFARRLAREASWLADLPLARRLEICTWCYPKHGYRRIAGTHAEPLYLVQCFRSRLAWRRGWLIFIHSRLVGWRYFFFVIVLFRLYRLWRGFSFSFVGLKYFIPRLERLSFVGSKYFIYTFHSRMRWRGWVSCIRLSAGKRAYFSFARRLETMIFIRASAWKYLTRLFIRV